MFITMYQYQNVKRGEQWTVLSVDSVLFKWLATLLQTAFFINFVRMMHVVAFFTTLVHYAMMIILRIMPYTESVDYHTTESRNAWTGIFEAFATKFYLWM